MPSFFIDIQLPEGSSLDALQLEDSNRCAVVTTEALALTPTDGDHDVAKYAAIFVPSTLVDASFSGQSSSSRLLHHVHPYLGQNFNLSACFLLRNDHHAPSDILLLDLSHSPPSEIDHLLVEMSGQHLHSGPDAVLKLLPVSDVRINAPPTFSIPHCAVCLHRIEPSHIGLPKSPTQQTCSRFCREPCLQQALLQPWPRPSHCVVCETLHRYWKQDPMLKCQQCGLQENLWVCMICGFVGCGRYSNRHGVEHYDQSKHLLSLELATCRIWEYDISEFVHRHDILECPSCPSLPRMLDERQLAGNTTSTKKAVIAGQEYEVLLMSALEDQAQHYEGMISTLRADLTSERVDQVTVKEAEEIDNLRACIESLHAQIDGVSGKLLRVQNDEAKHRDVSQRLLREQQFSQDVLKNIRLETEAETLRSKAEMEELEAQIADLKANQNMRVQFSGELANAHILATNVTETWSRNSGKGKLKSRRMFRK